MGPRKPSATRDPLVTSAIDAAAAKVRPCGNPSWTKNSPVLLSPAAEPTKQLAGVRRHHDPNDEPNEQQSDADQLQLPLYVFIVPPCTGQ